MATAVPAYLDVKRRLAGMLAHHKPGARLPPLLQLADRLGAGQTNTHRAIRELVSEGLLISSPRRGTFVAERIPGPGRGRRTRPAAPILQKQTVHITHTRNLAPTGFLMTMIEAFEARMSSTGCRLTRTPVELDPSPRRRTPWPYDQLPGSGVVVINPDPFPDIRCRPDQTLVVINTAVESPVAMPGNFDVVGVEQSHSAYLAGRHLRERGGITACFLGRWDRDLAAYDETSRIRLRGFERGWGEPVDPAGQLRVVAYNVQPGAQQVAAWLELDPRPDCIFAASDELAVGFVLGAAAHGLTPHRDFQIVGFDGQAIGRELAAGPLTTVDVPCTDLGRRAAELMIDRFSHRDQPVRRLELACSLFQGQTTRTR